MELAWMKEHDDFVEKVYRHALSAPDEGFREALDKICTDEIFGKAEPPEPVKKYAQFVAEDILPDDLQIRFQEALRGGQQTMEAFGQSIGLPGMAAIIDFGRKQ